MVLKPTMDYTELTFAVNELKKFDKKLKGRMERGLRTRLGGVAKGMDREVASINPLPPLSGFENDARGDTLDWDPIKTKILTRLSAGKGRAILLVHFEGSPNKRMFQISEFAGSRNNYTTPQGRAMIEQLEGRFKLVQGKGGRFGFRAFLKVQPELLREAENVINSFVDRFNRTRSADG